MFRDIDPVVLYALLGGVIVVVIALIVITGYLDARRKTDADPGDSGPDG